MSDKVEPTPCPLCGYPQPSSRGQIALRGDAVPRCINRLCPARPACPTCGSEAIHHVKVTGEMRCRCGATFFPGV